MVSKKINRRDLREKSLQILYAYEFRGEGLTSICNDVLVDINDIGARDFSIGLVNKVISNKKILDESIKERVNNWEMDRIALIDRLLLKIGIAELLFFPDIPPKVTINEVIEIAKEFSTSNSGKFINGILDAILSQLKENGKLVKTGRGLVEESLPKKSGKK